MEPGGSLWHSQQRAMSAYPDYINPASASPPTPIPLLEDSWTSHNISESESNSEKVENML